MEQGKYPDRLSEKRQKRCEDAYMLEEMIYIYIAMYSRYTTKDYY